MQRRSRGARVRKGIRDFYNGDMLGDAVAGAFTWADNKRRARRRR